MVKHFYLALAALVFLAIAVNAAPAKMEQEELEAGDLPVNKKIKQEENSSADSDENDDDDDDDKDDDDDEDDKDEAEKKEESAEDDDDDDDELSFLRIRREAVETPAKVEAEAVTELPAEAEAEATPAASGTAVPTTRKPVLVLIRDALNKVTTNLPTEQVANNALQYFQLFQHFIQQTIEQVIDAAKDDDEDETTAVAPVASTDEDKKPETNEQEPEKNTDKIEVPVPVEDAVKPAEPAIASNVV